MCGSMQPNRRAVRRQRRCRTDQGARIVVGHTIAPAGRALCVRAPTQRRRAHVVRGLELGDRPLGHVKWPAGSARPSPLRDEARKNGKDSSRADGRAVFKNRGGERHVERNPQSVRRSKHRDASIEVGSQVDQRCAAVVRVGRRVAIDSVRHDVTGAIPVASAKSQVSVYCWNLTILSPSRSQMWTTCGASSRPVNWAMPL